VKHQNLQVQAEARSLWQRRSWSIVM